MSLLRYIDTCKPFEEIRDLIINNNNVLYETDEYLNALARASVNLDNRLVDFLLTFDINWQVENVFCYSMCIISNLYPTFNEYQREKFCSVFNKLVSMIDISSDNIVHCFNYILTKGNMLILQLFVEAGYLDNRDVPNCDPLIYYRLKYFKEWRDRH